MAIPSHNNQWLKELGEQEVKDRLSSLLYEALESMNQEGSAKVVALDLTPDNESITFKFSIHAIKEDDYVGFAGY